MAGSPTELQSMLRTNDNPNLDENWKAMEMKREDSGKSGRINGCAKLVDGVIVKVADDKVEKGEDDRETWGSKVDFLLSIIGFAVDLANVWRFPYLCYRNGGGAFLIPYFLMLFFGALPLFFMELTVGQFHGAGAISVWRIAPIFKGVGWAACLMAFYVAFYYNVIIAWALFYLGSSFTSVLPWTTCDHVWNSFKCEDAFNVTNTSLAVNKSLYNTPAEEFFERGVLGLQYSEGIHDLGQPRWQLVLSLMGVFVILYFSLWKGVKSSGKVVWVTATMPYLVLSILLVRGVMLPGAREGILYFITPRLDRLAEKQVWIDAAVQIFYSTGVGFGTHLAYSSYNKFNNNCYRDCLCTAGVNTFTSLFSGFVIFSYLGYMAQKQKVPLAEVADEGPGLVFIVYPEAIATLPGSVGWSIIFFIMLLTLGLDSAFGGLESVLTGLQDEFKWFFRRFKHSREIFTAVVISAAFLVALANVTTGGMYLLTIQDTFAAGTSLLFTVLIQSIGLAWFYGLRQFSQDIEEMLGFKPAIFWRICWKFVSPIFLGIVVLSSIINYTPLEYKGATGHYLYPPWANAVGWLIGLSTMLLIPVVAIYQLIKAKGTLSQRFAIVISPEWEHQAIRNGQPVKRYQWHILDSVSWFPRRALAALSPKRAKKAFDLDYCLLCHYSFNTGFLYRQIRNSLFVTNNACELESLISNLQAIYT